MAYLRLYNGTVVDKDKVNIRVINGQSYVIRYKKEYAELSKVVKEIKEFDETTEEFINFIDCFILVVNDLILPFDKDLGALESYAMKHMNPKIYGAVRYFDEDGLPAMRCVIQLNIDGEKGVWEALPTNYKLH